jgi:hypothetical protein
VYANSELIKGPPTLDDLKTTAEMFEAGVELNWSNVSVTVPPTRREKFFAKLRGKVPEEPKVVLDNLSGRVPLGSFTVIMGS